MLKFALPLLALASAPALAQSTDSVRIPIADLNLSTAAGQATMAGRVRRAVRTLCPITDHSSLTEYIGVRRCSKDAHASGKTQMQLAVAKARDGTANREIALLVR